MYPKLQSTWVVWKTYVGTRKCMFLWRWMEVLKVSLVQWGFFQKVCGSRWSIKYENALQKETWWHPQPWGNLFPEVLTGCPAMPDIWQPHVEPAFLPCHGAESYRMDWVRKGWIQKGLKEVKVAGKMTGLWYGLLNNKLRYIKTSKNLFEHEFIWTGQCQTRNG